MSKTAKFILSFVILATFIVLPRVALGDITVKEPDHGIKTETQIGTLISNGINVAIAVAAIAAFAYLIWGGIQWITSGGDKA